jgi:signal transduction histidine kinase
MPPIYLSSRLKVLIPVAGVLIIGLVVFMAVTLSLHPEVRQMVILVAAAGAVAVCAVVLLVWAVLIEHPLREIQAKMELLREGEMNVAVSFADRQDEIGDLGRNFNETVRQLREAREELQRLYSTQMSRAEHLATLGELAAGLAHEIRNPLAGIAGVMEIVGQDLPASSPGRQILQEVQDEVHHINKIISDLLDYARPKPAQFRPADLFATAEHAVALARQQVMSRPIQVRLSKEGELPLVVHDPGQIQQVFLNLLINSIQAMNGQGSVAVTLSQEGDQALVRVRDTGQGIAPQDLDKLFRPFFTTKGQGTGLGLSLARRIVENHGGRIEVESVPGKGTEFKVWLPCRKSTKVKAAS